VLIVELLPWRADWRFQPLWRDRLSDRERRVRWPEVRGFHRGAIAERVNESDRSQMGRIGIWLQCNGVRASLPRSSGGFVDHPEHKDAIAWLGSAMACSNMMSLDFYDTCYSVARI
jgi:hypothetical protein